MTCIYGTDVIDRWGIRYVTCMSGFSFSVKRTRVSVCFNARVNLVVCYQVTQVVFAFTVCQSSSNVVRRKNRWRGCIIKLVAGHLKKKLCSVLCVRQMFIVYFRHSSINYFSFNNLLFRLPSYLSKEAVDKMNSFFVGKHLPKSTRS